MRAMIRACAVLLFTLSAGPLAFAQPEAKAKPAETFVPAAAIGSVEGPAQFRAAGTTAWVPVKVGQAMGPSDALRTQKNGKVVLAFSDGSKVQIGENADFQVEEIQPAKFGLRLAIGILDAWVAKLKGRAFEVRTPSAVAAVRGSQIEVAVDQAGNTEVFCFSGMMTVGGEGRPSMDLPAGQTVKADTAGNVSAPAPVPPTVVVPAEPVVAIPEPKKDPEGVKPPPEGEKKGEKKADEKKPEEKKADAKKPDDKKAAAVPPGTAPVPPATAPTATTPPTTAPAGTTEAPPPLGTASAPTEPPPTDEPPPTMVNEPPPPPPPSVQQNVEIAPPLDTPVVSPSAP